MKTRAGWTQVQQGHHVVHDLERYPIQAQTNSAVGSGQTMNVQFLTSWSLYAGGVVVYFNSNPVFHLKHCTSNSPFPTDLPSETFKTWTITVIKNAGQIFFLILKTIV